MKPFLKWAGGKYRVLAHILRRLPPAQRLIEPFTGSSAVWLNTSYPTSVLADVNPDLIHLYQMVQRFGEPFIAYCQQFFTPETNTPDCYYRFRAEFHEETDAWRKAALFLYLNRHGYNGLCRYNAKGQFNVPFGRYRAPYFPDQEMRAFHRKAQAAQFLCADFRRVLAEARPGDVVYCDPPYVPVSATANFTDYSAGGFGLQDQEELAAWAESLAAQGIAVLISNHATPFTRRIYRRANVEYFEVRRTISCRSHSRGMASELLAYYEPKEQSRTGRGQTEVVAPMVTPPTLC